jgi:YidC/Oxa1 family membrane protein insertase
MFVTANVLQPLIDVFESVLKFFHDSGGISWGWSIVLLTIAVRALLVPLTLRQIKGMVRMQSFAPQMKELQKKYKDDKQRQQQEVMKFYKENKVNPFASCLPLVAQLPVFLSLYYMLRTDLKHEICGIDPHAANVATQVCDAVEKGSGQFLFIQDLTAKATGGTLAILIVLYVGSQLLSSILMPTTVDKTQRRIFMILPVLFVPFIIRFPSGLILYWITTNLWTVTQQTTLRKLMGAPKPPPKNPDGSTPNPFSDLMKQLRGEPATATAGNGGGGTQEGAARPRKRQPASVAVSPAEREPGAKPPPPPRKKKKRSGRRR